MFTDLDVHINGVLSNQYARAFLALLTAICAGYTLQPVPDWIMKLFHSNIFKSLVLFVLGCVILYPVTNEKINQIIIAIILILTLFGIFRYF
jgi:hypothetical protein